MTRIKDLSRSQRRVFDACRNGWFMSGEYRALSGGGEQRFWADSPRLLFHDVDRWYTARTEGDECAHVLVKCVQAL
jgi:hypothetical protein